MFSSPGSFGELMASSLLSQTQVGFEQGRTRSVWCGIGLKRPVKNLERRSLIFKRRVRGGSCSEENILLIFAGQ